MNLLRLHAQLAAPAPAQRQDRLWPSLTHLPGAAPVHREQRRARDNAASGERDHVAMIEYVAVG